MPNDALYQKLLTQLNATHVEIIDNSWQHAGHAGMANVHETEGTHLAVTIVSPQFEGLGLLQRHRAVHAVLQEDFAGPLHALELKVHSPAEWVEKQAQP